MACRSWRFVLSCPVRITKSATFCRSFLRPHRGDALKQGLQLSGARKRTSPNALSRSMRGFSSGGFSSAHAMREAHTLSGCLSCGIVVCAHTTCITLTGSRRRARPAADSTAGWRRGLRTPAKQHHPRQAAEVQAQTALRRRLRMPAHHQQRKSFKQGLGVAESISATFLGQMRARSCRCSVEEQSCRSACCGTAAQTTACNWQTPSSF